MSTETMFILVGLKMGHVTKDVQISYNQQYS